MCTRIGEDVFLLLQYENRLGCTKIGDDVFLSLPITRLDEDVRE
jgi:hypothetical protein